MPDRLRTDTTGMRGVLFDMDGTLLDSEKIWDITLQELAATLGGRLSARARAAMTGSNLYRSVSLVHDVPDLVDLPLRVDVSIDAPLIGPLIERLYAGPSVRSGFQASLAGLKRYCEASP